MWLEPEPTQWDYYSEGGFADPDIYDKQYWAKMYAEAYSPALFAMSYHHYDGLEYQESHNKPVFLMFRKEPPRPPRHIDDDDPFADEE